MVPLTSAGTNKVSSFMVIPRDFVQMFKRFSYIIQRCFHMMLGIEVKLYMELCSSRAWWPLAPNFCSWATRVLVFPYKSYAGQPRIYSFRALGSLQFSLEHSRYKWSPKKLCVCCLLSFCNIRKIWQPLDLNNAIIKWWLQPLCNGISNQNSNLQ